MTEAEWQGCDDLWNMLDYIWDRPVTQRKPRLFTCACLRCIWTLLAVPWRRQAVELAERYADGEINYSEIESFYAATARPSSYESSDVDDAVYMATTPDGLWATAHQGADAASHHSRVITGNPTIEAAIQARHRQLLRDVVGSPFRTVAIDPGWLTWHAGVIPQLAWAIYEDRVLPEGTLDLARLAILADALEEAGCNNANILTHLRSPGPHVRGCWCVDLLLGKE